MMNENVVNELRADVRKLRGDVGKVLTLLKGNGSTGFLKRIENLEKAMQSRLNTYIIVIVTLISLAGAIKAFFFA